MSSNLRAKVSKSAEWLIQILVRIEQVASAALLVAVLGLLLVQVGTRYLLSGSFTWTEEIARFGLVWLTFVSAGYVMARGRHIVVDVFISSLAARKQMALDVISLAVTAMVSVTILPASVQLTLSMSRVGSPAADVPMSFLYGASIFGFGLIALHSVLRIISVVRRGAEGHASESIGQETSVGTS